MKKIFAVAIVLNLMLISAPAFAEKKVNSNALEHVSEKALEHANENASFKRTGDESVPDFRNKEEKKALLEKRKEERGKLREEKKLEKKKKIEKHIKSNTAEAKEKAEKIKIKNQPVAPQS